MILYISPGSPFARIIRVLARDLKLAAAIDKLI